MDSNTTTTGFIRRPTPEEWSRMSWRARQAFVKNQKLQAQARARHRKKRYRDTAGKQHAQLMKMDKQLMRCSNCGAWMLERCWSGCDS